MYALAPEVREMTSNERIDWAHSRLMGIEAEITKRVHLPNEAQRIAIVGGVALNGAILFEGSVGKGKTLLARTIAEVIGGEFGRIQGVSDLMPSDITGVPIFNPGTREFEFSEGPIFSNVLLVDEQSRIHPKTQAALLEAAQEGNVTVNGETYGLPEPFILLATQNPSEHQEGTYEVAEALLDRYNICVPHSQMEEEDYMAIYTKKRLNESLSRAVNLQELVTIKEVIEREVRVEDDEVRRGARITRILRDLDGVSQSGMLNSYRPLDETIRYAKVFAVMSGDKPRRMVNKSDVDNAASFTLRHRTELSYKALNDGVTFEQVLADAISRLPVPAAAEASRQ